MQSTRESAVEKVKRQLEEDINNGVRAPGEPLDESKLMAQFNVSRTPVRTAILQLASHGLITIVPRSGTFVATMSPQQLLSMLEVLAELEAVSAKLCARRLSNEGREKLKSVHADAERIANDGDVAAYEAYNAEWHRLIYEGSLNAYLTEQILVLRRRTKVYRHSVFQEHGRIKISYADHGKVLEAIVAGDGEEASRLMLDHISGSSKDFLKLLARLPAISEAAR